MKKIVNGIEIDLTTQEIVQRQLDEEKELAYLQTREQKKAQEQTKKQSAIAKLKALGLTEEEVKALIGI